MVAESKRHLCIVKRFDNACMNSRQYTIRSIPPKLDDTLRRQARISGKSLNLTLLQALSKGAGHDSETTFDDLDWFIGSHCLDRSFDDAQKWLDSMPKDIK